MLTLTLCVSSKLQSIQNSIFGAAVNVIASANAARVDLQVDGRDITLTGTVDSSLDREQFIETMRQLEGVRVVKDELAVFDQQEHARTQRVDFREQLAAIDTASVTFEPGSSRLSLSSEAPLLQLASLLRNAPERQIKIAGHTDSSGSREFNLTISRQRAQAVADFLIARGIDERQLFVQGFGDTRPAFSNETEEGRAANRRIELVFMR